MTRRPRFKSLISLLWMCLALPLAIAQGDKFEFKYEAGKALSYDIVLKISMAMNMEMGGQVQATNMVYTMTYNATITATDKVKDGATTLDFKPSNIGGQWDIESAGSKVLMTLKGEHLKGTVNGQLFIDTENDIGVEEAKDVLDEMKPLYLAGQIDCDALGNIKRLHGNDDFVKFWTDMLAQQVGFYGIVFPEKPVAVGDAWEERLTLKKLDQLVLEGEGLRCDMKFTRLPDVEAKGGKLAVFELSAPFSHKNLKASMGGMGGETPLNIDKFERQAGGKMHFDQAKGIFTSSEIEVDVDVVMKTKAGPEDLGIDMKMGMEMEMKLVP